MGLLRIACVVIAFLIVPASGRQIEVPPNYPPAYRDVIAAGKMEGKVILYSTTGRAMADPLLEDFKVLYPGIQVDFVEFGPAELYERYRNEADTGAPSGDVVWSSAMDLQMKLIADGYAQAYMAPDALRLPAWAVYRDLGWGTTLEPVVFAYNKRLLSQELIPTTHIQIVRLMRDQPELLKNRVGVTDPEKNGLAFLLLGRDANTWPHIWDLATALGRARVQSFDFAGATIDRVADGSLAFAYNVMGSYATLRQQRAPDLGIVFLTDYTLAYSRIAFIAKGARQPNAAKLLIDYLISQRGQSVMAQRAQLFPVRSDVEGTATAVALMNNLGNRLKPIALGPGLLDSFDANQRAALLRRWNTSTAWK